MPDQTAANPVVDTYRGKKVRRYNLIVLRVSSSEYKKIIDAKIDKGMTPREMIEENQILRNVQVHGISKNNISVSKG